MDNHDHDRLPGDPTRQEILERCELIRATWTPEQTELRYQFSRARLTMPAYASRIQGSRVAFVPLAHN